MTGLKVGVLLPSTNTVAEPELHRLLPDGVTVHAGRMLVTKKEVGTDEDYLYLNEQMMAALEPTVANLLTCRPDHLALSMTAMSVVGGPDTDDGLRRRLEAMAGVPVSSGPSSILGALRTLGASRVALLSPFQPAVQREAVRYFEQCGISVEADHTFLAQTTIDIATIGPAEIRAAVAAIDSDRVEAIIQLGTNVSMAWDAAAAEWWLGKPVLHVNTAMAWDVLRSHRIEHQIAGYGCLFAAH